jgi:hypothetical protein
MTEMGKYLFMFVMLVLAACSKIQKDGEHTPIPTEVRQIIILDSIGTPPSPLAVPISPASISPPRLNISGGNEEICLELWEGDFWVSGYNAEELTAYLAEHTDFYVDNQSIPRSEITRISTWDGYSMGSQGSFRGLLDCCINIQNLNKGLHIVNISIQGPNHITVSHAWKFRID